MLIRRAERKKAKLRLGISGASGSGKTWSALEIATGMEGKIGMIDTESGRGELYGSDFEYDIIRLEAPFSAQRYVEAIKVFEESGYDILIIDSLSHAWNGAGGVLTTVDAGGGWFSKGGQRGSAEQNMLLEAIITSKMHIITTFRAKTEYAVEKDDRGKNVPRKIGLAPIQRDGIEYEFTLFMNLEQNHFANVTKDNTKMFDQQFIKPSKEMGKHLIKWLNSGEDVVDYKDNFINVILPEALESLLICKNTVELSKEFVNFTRQYAKEFPEFMEPYIAAKDKRKDELFHEELGEDPLPVISKSSKYPQTLTQLAQEVA
jgi:AAA domain-containing protein